MTATAIDIARLADELALALEAEPDGLIAHFGGEPAPEDMALVSHAPPGKRAGPRDMGAGRPGSAASTAPPLPRVAPSPEALAANVKCTLCADRMFPVRRFQRRGRLPILVLYHSGAFGEGRQAAPRRDRSREFIFGSEAEDDLFRRLLEAAGLDLEAPHYQEFPACHFNAVRSAPEDWRARGEACLTHVAERVRRDGIRLLLTTGPAAVILFGAARARELAAASSTASVALPEVGEIPALVLRSPAALLALEERRRRAEEGSLDSAEAPAADFDSGESQTRDERTRLRNEERSIKASMLEALRTASRGVA